MAIGLSPYTSVGYLFKDKRPLEGTPDSFVYSMYEGEGGISKLLLTNSIELDKHLSLGINIGYLFGSSTQKETQDIMAVGNEMSARAFYSDLGIQYKYRKNRSTLFTFGAVYGLKQKVNVKNTVTVKTISNPVEVSNRKSTQYTPEFMGLGGSIKHNRTVLHSKYLQNSSD